MLRKEVPWLKVEFFRATDGKVDLIPEEEVSKTWNTKHNSLYGAYEDVMDKDGKVIHTAAEFAEPGVDYEFSPGERGCAHSHYRMWKQAARAEGPTLILEDDVQLEFQRSGSGEMSGEVFTARLQLGMEEAEKRSADVLYLGWSGFRDGNLRHLKPIPGRKSSVVRKAEYVWTTVAYVIWPLGAKKLLEQARPMNQPVDNFMGWESREGRVSSWVLLDEGDGDDTWSGGIVTQLDFTGDSDIKKSDGGDQGDDPTAYLAKKVAADTLMQPRTAMAATDTDARAEAFAATANAYVTAEEADSGAGGDSGEVETTMTMDSLAHAPKTVAAAEDAEGRTFGDVEMVVAAEAPTTAPAAVEGAEDRAGDVGMTAATRVRVDAPAKALDATVAVVDAEIGSGEDIEMTPADLQGIVDKALMLAGTSTAEVPGHGWAGA